MSRPRIWNRSWQNLPSLPSIFRSSGRGYSNARILRERLGYDGELRAVGDVLRDQLFLMRRCGFDSFALRSDRDAAQAVSALADFRHAYQHATIDPGVPLVRRDH